MSKANRNTGKTMTVRLNERDQQAVAKEFDRIKITERAIREASKMLGLPVSEVRRQIETGLRVRAEEERAARVKGREQSIRLSVKNLRDCLTDIHDLANCGKRGEVGALDPETVLHAIEAMTVSAREWLDDLESDAGGDRG